MKLIGKHKGNHILKDFVRTAKCSKGAFKSITTYSKTFWKECTFWTTGKNLRPVFDINLKKRGEITIINSVPRMKQ